MIFRGKMCSFLWQTSAVSDRFDGVMQHSKTAD